MSIFLLKLLCLTAVVSGAPRPVVWYEFEEGNGATTVIDSSSNGHDGMVSGSYLTTTGFLGAAFDSTTSEVSPPLSAITSESSFSIALWSFVSSPGTGSVTVVHAKPLYNDNVDCINMMLPLNLTYTVDLEQDDDGNSCRVSWDLTSALDSWHMWGLTYNAVGHTISAYVDGQVVDECLLPTPQVLDLTGSFRIGIDSVLIDNFRYFDNLLTTSEMMDLFASDFCIATCGEHGVCDETSQCVCEAGYYSTGVGGDCLECPWGQTSSQGAQAAEECFCRDTYTWDATTVGCSGAPPDPALLYRFDESAFPTTVLDSTANSFDGLVRPSSADNSGPAGVEGVQGGALQLMSNYYVEVPVEALSDFRSIAFWAFVTEESLDKPMLIGLSDAGEAFSLTFTGDDSEYGVLLIMLDIDGTYLHLPSSIEVPILDDWYFYTVVYDPLSGHVSFSIDGDPIVSTTSGLFAPVDVSLAFYIGLSVGGYYWAGVLDNFRVYTTVMTMTAMMDQQAVDICGEGCRATEGYCSIGTGCYCQEGTYYSSAIGECVSCGHGTTSAYAHDVYECSCKMGYDLGSAQLDTCFGTTEPDIWYKFEEDVLDSSGLGFDGQLADPPADYVAGYSGFAISLLGNKHVIMQNYMFVSAPMTISFWCLVPSLTAGSSNHFFGSDSFNIILYDEDLAVRWVIGSDGEHSLSYALVDLDFFDHYIFWAFVADTWQGRMAIYADGILVAEENALPAYSIDFPSGAFLGSAMLGGGAGSNYFAGEVDEFRVYYEALTEMEINDVMISDACGSGCDEFGTCDTSSRTCQCDPGYYEVPELRPCRTCAIGATTLEGATDIDDCFCSDGYEEDGDGCSGPVPDAFVLYTFDNVSSTTIPNEGLAEGLQATSSFSFQESGTESPVASGSALYFPLDVALPYVTLPVDAILSCGTDFTISLWVNSDGNETTQNVIRAGGYDGSDLVFELPGMLTVDDVSTPVTLSSNDWFHVAISFYFNGYTHEYALLVDGELLFEGTCARQTFDELLELSSSVENPFVGNMDNARVHCVALGVVNAADLMASDVCPRCQDGGVGTCNITSRQCVCPADYYYDVDAMTCVACAYASTSPPGSVGVVSCVCKEGYTGEPVEPVGCVGAPLPYAFYEFEEPTSTTVSDSGEASHVAQLAELPTEVIEGFEGYGCDLRRDSQWVDFDPGLFDGGAFTLSLWVNVSVWDGTNYKLVSAQGDTGEVLRVSYPNEYNDIAFEIFSGSGVGFYSTFDPSIHEAQWRMFTITYDPSLGEAAWYLDGNLLSAQTGNNFDPVLPSAGFRLGADLSGPLRWDGVVDSVRFFREALSENQVYDLMVFDTCGSCELDAHATCDTNSRECTCDDGFYRNESDDSCVWCGYHYTSISGASSVDECTCEDGFRENSVTGCQPILPLAHYAFRNDTSNRIFPNLPIDAPDGATFSGTGGLNFNGKPLYLPDNMFVSVVDEITVAFKIDAGLSGRQTVLRCVDEKNETSLLIEMLHPDSAVYFEVRNAAGSGVLVWDGTVDTRRSFAWFHMAFTANTRTGVMGMYYNGIEAPTALVAPLAAASPFLSMDTCALGGFDTGHANGDGNVADLIFSATALRDSEVTAFVAEMDDTDECAIADACAGMPCYDALPFSLVQCGCGSNEYFAPNTSHTQADAAAEADSSELMEWEGLCVPCAEAASAPYGNLAAEGCVCGDGFVGDGVEHCELEGTPCESLGDDACAHTCVDTDNGYQCVCGANSFGDGLDCIPCPSHSTSPVNSTTLEACACDSGYYMDLSAGLCEVLDDTVMLSLGGARVLRRPNALTLTASITSQGSTAVVAGGVWQWAVEVDPTRSVAACVDTGVSFTPSSSTSQLTVPSNSLNPPCVYTVSATLRYSSLSSESLESTAVVQVDVVYSNLVVSIDGGEQTLAYHSEETLMLSAAATYDPDYRTRPFFFAWGIPPELSPHAGSLSLSDSQLEVPLSLLTQGTFEFSVSAWVDYDGWQLGSADTRNSSATAVVTLAYNVPSVGTSILLPVGTTDRINPSDKLTLRGTYAAGYETSLLWSAVVLGVGATSTPVDLTGLASTALNRRDLVIPANRLEPGATYTFTLRVSSVSDPDVYSEANRELSVNIAPYGGTCTVDPPSGAPAQDLITVACTGWTDDDPASSLTYRLSIIDDSFGWCSVFPVSDFATSGTVQFMLPEIEVTSHSGSGGGGGSGIEGDTEVELVMTIKDLDGAVATHSMWVGVRNLEEETYAEACNSVAWFVDEVMPSLAESGQYSQILAEAKSYGSLLRRWVCEDRDLSVRLAEALTIGVRDAITAIGCVGTWADLAASSSSDQLTFLEDFTEDNALASVELFCTLADCVSSSGTSGGADPDEPPTALTPTPTATSTVGEGSSGSVQSVSLVLDGLGVIAGKAADETLVTRAQSCLDNLVRSLTLDNVPGEEAVRVQTSTLRTCSFREQFNMGAGESEGFVMSDLCEDDTMPDLMIPPQTSHADEVVEEDVTVDAVVWLDGGHTSQSASRIADDRTARGGGSLASPVTSLNVYRDGDTLTDFDPAVEILLGIVKYPADEVCNREEVFCEYWDPHVERWRTDGCETIEVDIDSDLVADSEGLRARDVVCACTHMTDFAMMVYEDEEGNRECVYEDFELLFLALAVVYGFASVLFLWQFGWTLTAANTPRLNTVILGQIFVFASLRTVLYTLAFVGMLDDIPFAVSALFEATAYLLLFSVFTIMLLSIVNTTLAAVRVKSSFLGPLRNLYFLLNASFAAAVVTLYVAYALGGDLTAIAIVGQVFFACLSFLAAGSFVVFGRRVIMRMEEGRKIRKAAQNDSGVNRIVFMVKSFGASFGMQGCLRLLSVIYPNVVIEGFGLYTGFLFICEMICLLVVLYIYRSKRGLQYLKDVGQRLTLLPGGVEMSA